jgi:hypothetical protein
MKEWQKPLAVDDTEAPYAKNDTETCRSRGSAACPDAREHPHEGTPLNPKNPTTSHPRTDPHKSNSQEYMLDLCE